MFTTRIRNVQMQKMPLTACHRLRLFGLPWCVQIRCPVDLWGISSNHDVDGARSARDSASNQTRTRHAPGRRDHDKLDPHPALYKRVYSMGAGTAGVHIPNAAHVPSPVVGQRDDDDQGIIGTHVSNGAPLPSCTVCAVGTAFSRVISADVASKGCKEGAKVSAECARQAASRSRSRFARVALDRFVLSLERCWNKVTRNEEPF